MDWGGTCMWSKSTSSSLVGTSVCPTQPRTSNLSTGCTQQLFVACILEWFQNNIEMSSSIHDWTCILTWGHVNYMGHMPTFSAGLQKKMQLPRSRQSHSRHKRYTCSCVGLTYRNKKPKDGWLLNLPNYKEAFASICFPSFIMSCWHMCLPMWSPVKNLESKWPILCLLILTFDLLKAKLRTPGMIWINWLNPEDKWLTLTVMLVLSLEPNSCLIWRCILQPSVQEPWLSRPCCCWVLRREVDHTYYQKREGN